jgi:hypothetical protein
VIARDSSSEAFVFARLHEVGDEPKDQKILSRLAFTGN